jgi:hypothetical protein
MLPNSLSLVLRKSLQGSTSLPMSDERALSSEHTVV